MPWDNPKKSKIFNFGKLCFPLLLLLSPCPREFSRIRKVKLLDITQKMKEKLGVKHGSPNAESNFLSTGQGFIRLEAS